MYKTQYIAPLRVKLDPSAHGHATVDYLSEPDRLTVQWTNVSVAEPFRHPSGGVFTFQVTVHESGEIVFVYLRVPDLLTADALYDSEPVAGLSDAFLVGDSELHVYHTMNVANPDIMTKTVVRFTPKPTCIQQRSCEACSALRASTTFACAWCPKAHRCSDGADRLREKWDKDGCGASNVTGGADECALASHSGLEWRSSAFPQSANEGGGASAGAMISAVVSSVLLLILLCIVLGYVYVFGKSNPGGVAERLALRMESGYRRFGGQVGGKGAVGEVEMGRTPSPDQDDNDGERRPKEDAAKRENNNSITVSF